MHRTICCLAAVLMLACGSGQSKDDNAARTATGQTPPPATGTSPASGAVPMRGMFVYMADAGLFTDCGSGKRYPVATEGDNIALERAYTSANVAPGSPVLVRVRARVDLRPPMEGDAMVETLVVEKFEEAWPGGACAGEVTDPELEDIDWLLVELDGQAIELGRKQLPPDLRLSSGDASAQGFAGCNRFTGTYDLDGEGLHFGPIAATKMLCEGTMALEDAYLKALGAAETYRVSGASLELYSGGRSLVRFQAAPPKGE